MAGTPVADAVLDCWQATSEGFYDSQMGEGEELGMRGVYRTDTDGRYLVRTTRPKWYPVPTDGPVGDMLRATNRHPYRPGHVHFMITAPGYQPLVTHIFDKDGEYLDSDTVFAVKDSLKVQFVERATQEALGHAGRRARPPYVDRGVRLRPEPGVAPGSNTRRISSGRAASTSAALTAASTSTSYQFRFA